MGKKNITISLDENLAKEARIMAAERETSVSQLLAEQLRSLVEVRHKLSRAKNDFLRLVKKEYNLNYSSRSFSRDEIHEL
ncbi:MAG: DUF6364 family protein [bacterium]